MIDPSLTIDEIKLLENLIQKLPINQHFEVQLIGEEVKRDSATFNKVVRILREYKIITGGYANPILGFNGEKFKEIKNWNDFLLWYQQEKNDEKVIKWIAKKWWIPLVATFVFIIVWDCLKEFVIFKRGASPEYSPIKVELLDTMKVLLPNKYSHSDSIFFLFQLHSNNGK